MHEEKVGGTESRNKQIHNYSWRCKLLLSNLLSKWPESHTGALTNTIYVLDLGDIKKTLHPTEKHSSQCTWNIHQDRPYPGP